MKLEFSRQFFETYINIKFNENPSSGSRVVPFGQTGEQTDGRTDMTKLIAAFHNIVNPSKNAKDIERRQKHRELYSKHTPCTMDEWYREPLEAEGHIAENDNELL